MYQSAPPIRTSGVPVGRPYDARLTPTAFAAPHTRHFVTYLLYPWSASAFVEAREFSGITIGLWAAAGGGEIFGHRRSRGRSGPAQPCTRGGPPWPRSVPLRGHWWAGHGHTHGPSPARHREPERRPAEEAVGAGQHRGLGSGNLEIGPENLAGLRRAAGFQFFRISGCHASQAPHPPAAWPGAASCSGTDPEGREKLET